MALFSSKPKKTTAPKADKVVKNVEGRLSNVLKSPWLSEKAFMGTENGVYVFSIPPEVTKHDVASAIKLFYKVTPRKIAIVNLPGKRKALRTRRGMATRASRHKAYVYLKKGETIQFA